MSRLCYNNVQFILEHYNFSSVSVFVRDVDSSYCITFSDNLLSKLVYKANILGNPGYSHERPFLLVT